MKQITIYKNGKITHGPNIFNSEEQANEWLDKHTKKKTFGRPETYYKLDEIPADVIADEIIRHEIVNGEELVLVKANYIVEIIDYVESYKLKRKREYPSWEEVMEAMIENMEGRPQKLTLIKEQRALVRAKYPKN